MSLTHDESDFPERQQIRTGSEHMRRRSQKTGRRPVASPAGPHPAHHLSRGRLLRPGAARPTRFDRPVLIHRGAGLIDTEAEVVSSLNRVHPRCAAAPSMAGRQRLPCRRWAFGRCQRQPRLGGGGTAGGRDRASTDATGATRLGIKFAPATGDAVAATPVEDTALPERLAFVRD